MRWYMKRFARMFFLGVLMTAMLGTISASKAGLDVKKAADEVVARELSFSARAQVIDARDAFLEFFAADARMFRPDPIPARELLQKSPSWGINLRWWPVEVAISADGRLAYSTGPVERRQEASSLQPDGFGTYFSIWRKNDHHVWEVAADLGTDTPTLWAPRNAAVIQRLPEGLGGAAGPNSLLGVDAEYAQKAASGMMAALKALAAPEYRFLPARGMPVVGVEAAQNHLLPGPASWVAAGELVAASGDLGVTYGSGEGGYAPGHFGYLRVWQRNAAGQWRLLAEVINLPRS
jgi:ketosteroid isomerase-like protein